jgi:hypothetical protein
MKRNRLSQWFSARPVSNSRRPSRFRPAIELLEARTVPSIVPLSSPVDVVAGAGGQSVTTQRTAAEAASGAYRVVWENGAQGGQYGISTRLFGPDGVPQGSPYHLPGTGSADSEATIAVNASGAFAVAWTHSAGTTKIVMLERFNAAGAPLGLPITITSASKYGSTHQPSVALDTAGDIVLAYTDSAPPTSNNSPTGNQVKGVYYPSAGVSSPLAITPWTATSQPSAAMSAAGSFVVAFTRDASPTNQDVYVQRFKAGGTAQGTAIAVATSAHSENQPSAAIDAPGHFVVAYTYVRSSQPSPQPLFPNCIDYQSEVHAVLFNPQGGTTATETVWASSKVTENAYDPSAAMDAAANFVVGYTRGGNDTRAGANGDYVPADGPATVWASAYKASGALQQAGIDLSANSLEAPPVSPTGARGPYSLSDYRPTVALSATGHLVADWVNFGLTLNGDVAGTAVFTQTFVNAPFQYKLTDGIGIGMLGGMPTAYHVAITRDPGFSGPIILALAPLPPGVAASSDADSPAPTEVRTITLKGPDGPGVTLASVLTISGGGVNLTPTVTLHVTPSVITGWSSAAGPNLLIKGFSATITGTGFVPGSTVQFGAPGATAMPAIKAGGTLLTVTVPASAVPGPITIIRPGGDPIVSATNPTYIRGRVASLSSIVGYAPGYNVATLDAGSEVDVFGAGFEQGARVIFGDPGTTDPNALKTLADQVAASPSSISLDGTVMHVNVPRYAVDGPVVVVEPDGTGLKLAAGFHINNYRNTFGFSFQNGFPYTVTWDNVKNEFGADQVDIYGPHPQAVPYPPFVIAEWGDLGVPTPLALEAWAIMKKTLDNDGTCFGMALTSILMNEFHPDWINATNGLPPGVLPTVFNLQMNDALGTMIEQNHIAQDSAEVISYFLDWQAENLNQNFNSLDIYKKVNDALQAGDHPIISIQAGAQHSVVAYDLEPGPHNDGGFYIDVYDPNRPFNGPYDPTESTDITNHRLIEQASRIYIDPANGWSFTMAGSSSKGMAGLLGNGHGGGYGTLEVIPASLVANGVTFPVTPTGLLQVANFFTSSAPVAPAKIVPPPMFVLAPGAVPERVAPPPTLVAPAAPRSGSTAPVVSAIQDLALTVARARAANLALARRGKPAGATSLENADLLWQDAQWLSDRLSTGRGR